MFVNDDYLFNVVNDLELWNKYDFLWCLRNFNSKSRI